METHDIDPDGKGDSAEVIVQDAVDGVQSKWLCVVFRGQTYLIVSFSVVFVTESSQSPEHIVVGFKLSDSVLDMKEWLSRKWIRNADTLVLSFSGM